jgi:lipopolysaccharide transport system ATP-binding protein
VSMSRTVIELENVSKYYRLGSIGGATLSEDINAWWAKLRGKENPLLKIGEKDYGNQEGEFIWALRDINLKVEQGDILGIIGANGAGKSTLLKILSRITGPTSGKVKIKGRIGSLLEVGTGFHPDLTGRENVYLNGAILGMRKQEIENKFDEIVAFSGVEKYIDTPVKRYSSGMRVRLGFAVAAHLDPEILIVDEVLAVGDAEFQKKCLGKMSDVAGEGRTVLFVSHNMDSVENLCKNGVLLVNGQNRYEGKIEDVVQEYIHMERLSFINQYKQELTNIKRENDTYGNLIKLKNIEFMSKNNVFNIWDKIALQFTYETTEPIENLFFRLLFKREDNSIIFSINSNFYKDIPAGTGEYTISVEVPYPNLASGIYKIEIVARQAEMTLDCIVEALTFKVKNNQNFPNHIRKHGLLPYSVWKI